MKREPQASTKTRNVRATHNSLFFNNSAYNDCRGCSLPAGLFGRFARNNHFPLSNELHAIAEHRPAHVPGAD